MSSTPQKMPKAKLSRRTLIVGVGVLAGAGAGGGYALWRWRRFSGLEPNARRLAWLVSARIRWLGVDVDDSIVMTWIEEHVRHYGPLEAEPAGASHQHTQSLLLSTNLYTTGQSERGDVTEFVSYYDPVKNPCYNPLRGL